MKRTQLTSVLIMTGSIGFILTFLSFITNQMGDFRMDRIPQINRGEQHEVQEQPDAQMGSLASDNLNGQYWNGNVSGTDNNEKDQGQATRETNDSNSDQSTVSLNGSGGVNSAQNGSILNQGDSDIRETVETSEQETSVQQSSLGTQNQTTALDRLSLPASDKEILRVGKVWSDKTYVISYGKQILSGVNRLRTQKSMSELIIDPKLSLVASARAAELCAGDYISHQRYQSAENYTTLLESEDAAVWSAENIAWGYQDVQTTITSWKDNPAYYANLMNESAVRIGFGYCTFTDHKYKPVWIIITAGQRK